ncbi:hypothetical protein R3W88_023515 [Solanum pinnatisectum]|uniref:SHSP domain-containing protein n=1 Tax=Solanum pinnatisectum TaxID=50273 RepID=A0AAV9M1I9_9SOLN|nr:hypothetical protein R3W88_023515 [Solanum pinnatisectum]
MEGSCKLVVRLRVLIIIKKIKKNENETWRHVERPRGKFYRKFWLPENAKIDEVKASMENGVLTVTIPKQEIKKSEVKTIEIN